MEASLYSFPSSRPPRLPSLTLTKSLNPILVPAPRRPHRAPAAPLVVRAAISRSKKEATVELVRRELEGCHLLAGIRYTGLTVKHLQELRRALPPEVRLVVAKNTLVGKAVEGTPWAALQPCMAGMNAWLFVHTEEIPAALRPYRAFQRERKLEANDFTGAVFEGRFYAPDEFQALETMPSRAEVYAKLLGVMQGPAISLVTTLQAPARDLVLTLKAYVKKLEDEESGAAATAAAPQ